MKFRRPTYRFYFQYLCVAFRDECTPRVAEISMRYVGLCMGFFNRRPCCCLWLEISTSFVGLCFSSTKMSCLLLLYMRMPWEDRSQTSGVVRHLFKISKYSAASLSPLSSYFLMRLKPRHQAWFYWRLSKYSVVLTLANHPPPPSPPSPPPPPRGAIEFRKSALRM